MLTRRNRGDRPGVTPASSWASARRDPAAMARSEAGVLRTWAGPPQRMATWVSGFLSGMKAQAALSGSVRPSCRSLPDTACNHTPVAPGSGRPGHALRTEPGLDIMPLCPRCGGNNGHDQGAPRRCVLAHALRAGPEPDIVPICPVAAAATGHVHPASQGPPGKSTRAGIGGACPPRGHVVNERWPPPQGRPPLRCYFKLPTAKPQGADSLRTRSN